MGNTYDTEIARIEADHIQTKWRTTEDYRWGYTGDRGPETWWIHYPSASGGMQSPIDIETEETLLDAEFGRSPLEVHYHLQAVHGSGAADHAEGVDEIWNLVNRGSTLCVDITNSQSYITGGPCREYSYVLEEFHLHWGETDSAGSEHFVNGLSTAAEIHAVHWNEDLYSCYEDAAKSNEGIVILAVFLKLSEYQCNDNVYYMSNNLEDLDYRDDSITIQPSPNEFNLRSILPDNVEKYWSYQGSFCTPPCYETVTWIVFETPSHVTSRVLNKLRALRTYCENETRPADEPSDGRLTFNHRPTQPIGTRKVSYVDCALFREHHEAEDGLRPFRSRGVGDGPRNGFIGGRGEQQAAGVRSATVPGDVGKHSRNGVRRADGEDVCCRIL